MGILNAALDHMWVFTEPVKLLLVFLLGAVLARRNVTGLWVRKARRGATRMHAGGRFFWVIPDDADHERTREVIHILEGESVCLGFAEPDSIHNLADGTSSTLPLRREEQAPDQLMRVPIYMKDRNVNRLRDRRTLRDLKKRPVFHESMPRHLERGADGFW